ncbi:hypothetical protein J4E86_007135 [Alternaria arbusti]|uniref:uncharacterized protein n=1 Tax=Alternaria arbusti TaxID=232088 RepID=UPI002220F446|nr:uncharacterized protein J4E86_007135 [Alternaria arbusti]KAI4951719.1 hypothetical protein J4E86_007135 [Alternaria arbusti]
MKTSSIALTLAAAAVTSAQDPFYNISSAPFFLVVTSEDGKVNDTLSACHVGAAIESLCLSNAGVGDSPEPLDGAQFQFNTSVYSQAPEDGFGVPGILTWWLNTTTLDIPSSAAFNLDPTSNLAGITLSPGSGSDTTMLAFDSQDELTYQGYVRGENNTGNYQEFYRWYNNLAWGLGAGKPDNPTCVSVNVTRINAAMFKLVPILLAFAALTHADADCEYDCEPIYTVQSDPFNLVLISEDPSLNGKTLSACHAGAAVFTLCPTLSEEGAQYPVVLTHNTTDTAITNIFGTQGILSWTIPYDPYPIDLSVLLQPQDIVPLSIAQLAMTYSGDGSLSFDSNDILNFQNPITWGAEKPEMDPPSCIKHFVILSHRIALMIPTLFFFPLALLTKPTTAQSSPSSSPNTPIPSSSTETIVDVSSTFTSTYSADFSSGLPGIVLSTFTSGRQNATATSSTTTQEVTAIVGLSPSTESSNGTASSTTKSARPSPTNTQPCNGYVEFCQRRFSNISMVVAHNSPFVRPHNAASNQDYPVLNQLNDGVRGLQFETQKPNETSAIRLCHTSCNLLDVGTLESYLATVKGWLDQNPFEVIAIMMGNNNGQDTRNPATDYIAPFQNSGIMEYVWTPPSASLNLTDWPTLAEMIIRNKRVVVMLDYGADQEQVPWLLSEFNYQWQTPFSPTDPSFPCTEQRPPNQPEEVSRERMYVMNHNLNIEVSLPGVSSILIPAYSLLDEINAVSGNGSVGLNVQNCEKMWTRPPNWILVDYYNYGNFNGSVFQVAATANNVTYNEQSCCGTESTSAAHILRSQGLLIASLFVGAYLLW